MIRFLDLEAQYLELKDEIDEAIRAVCRSGAFVGGHWVEKFEAEFASYHEADFCVGVGNGTDALLLAIEALDLPEDSEILVPANTFIATSEAVSRARLKPVFVDCSPNYTIDVDDLHEKITSKSSAIIAVHLFGHPCDMNAITKMAKEYGLNVIEDCAQAHGAMYEGSKVGTIGEIGTFSFYPGKNLGAYGDGGAIITNDPVLADRCRMLANHGRREKYIHEFEGMNSRLDAVQAAVLSVKLQYLDIWLEKRMRLASAYSTSLSDVCGLVLPDLGENVRHALHLYVVRATNRNELQEFLAQQDIQTGIHYPVTLPNQPAYSFLARSVSTPIADAYAEEILSLPIGEHLTEEQIIQVASVVNDFMYRD